MKTLLQLGILATVAAIGLGVFGYVRHTRKQEDSVAAFAINQIKTEYSGCYGRGADDKKAQRHAEAAACTTSRCVTDSIIGSLNDLSDAWGECDRAQAASMEEWALVYPRQAQALRATMLEQRRKNDAVRMAEGGR
jgi:hypothetical protein